jgi:purine-binding chemotaxis protein CheW
MIQERTLDTDNGQALLISTFHLGDTMFGIDTLRVQEAIKIPDMTTVPRAQASILGVVNLRGRIVTIIDLNRKLGLELSPVTADSRLIIVSWADEQIGFLVDRIDDVIPIERSEISPSPSNVKGIQGQFFEGVHQSEKGLLVVLNVDAVLIDGSTKEPL